MTFAYPNLFEPIRLAHVILPNRVIMGSMHTGLEEKGDWNRLAEYYATRARGGVGLIVTGGMAPNPEGAVYQGAAGLYNDTQIANHRIVTDTVRPRPGNRRSGPHGGSASQYDPRPRSHRPRSNRRSHPFHLRNWMRPGSKSRSPISPRPRSMPRRRGMTGSRSWGRKDTF